MVPVSVPADYYDARPASIDCAIIAAQRQGVPANVLLALASIESGKNGQKVKNTNGTFDVGHWQINSMHLENKRGLLKSLKNKGVTLQDIASRGCYNAELAAYILRVNLDEKTGQDYWTRAANYHSHTPKYNAIYKAKLIPLASRWALWLQQHYEVDVSFK